MRNHIRYNILFSDVDYKALEELSNEAGISKSDYIRTLIQTISICRQVDKQLEKAKNNEEITVKWGGYGFTLGLDYINKFADEISNNLKTLEKGIKITPQKDIKNARKRHVKPTKKAA